MNLIPLIFIITLIVVIGLIFLFFGSKQEQKTEVVNDNKENSIYELINRLNNSNNIIIINVNGANITKI